MPELGCQLHHDGDGDFSVAGPAGRRLGAALLPSARVGAVMRAAKLNEDIHRLLLASATTELVLGRLGVANYELRYYVSEASETTFRRRARRSCAGGQDGFRMWTTSSARVRLGMHLPGEPGPGSPLQHLPGGRLRARAAPWAGGDYEVRGLRRHLAGLLRAPPHLGLLEGRGLGVERRDLRGGGPPSMGRSRGSDRERSDPERRGGRHPEGGHRHVGGGACVVAVASRRRLARAIAGDEGSDEGDC